MLIRPFLNDRAKTYLTKLETTVSGDYERLKDAMLREFKLSPNVYLEHFNTCTKTSDDTYVKGTAFQPFLPPKLLLLCRILVATLISCTIRELWKCVIFPHVKFITSAYQNYFPFHNLVCYDIVTPSF